MQAPTKVFAHARGISHGIKEGMLQQLPRLWALLRVVQNAQLHKLTQLLVLYLFNALRVNALHNWNGGNNKGCSLQRTLTCTQAHVPARLHI